MTKTMKNLFRSYINKKNKGFLLAEALAATIIISIAITTINQILLGKIKRMHYNSKALKAQRSLSEQLEKILNLETEPSVDKNQPNTANNILLKRQNIVNDSCLENFKDLVQPYIISTSIDINGKQQSFTLYCLKIKKQVKSNA